MRTVVALVGLVGCNQAFDLRATVSVDAEQADVDGDGVADATDNCSTVANVDQANADDDGFGDACDTCPTKASSSIHDEDRDRGGDDCDPCPGIVDFATDEDTDGIGDICDPSDKMSMPNQRVRFEPFLSLPAEWMADATSWSQSDDAVAPDAPLAPTDRGLRNTAITTPAGVWSATIGLTSQMRWDASDRYAIEATSAEHRVVCKVTCSMVQAATVCQGVAELDGVLRASFNIFPQPSTRVGIVVKNFGSPSCIFGDFIELQAGVAPTDAMQISIIASPRVRVAWFELIQ